MKKGLFAVIALTIILLGLSVYGLWPRPETDYLKLQPTELHAVLCISDNGDAITYHIPLPKLSGFTAEDAHDLEEAFAQGFCDNL